GGAGRAGCAAMGVRRAARQPQRDGDQADSDVDPSRRHDAPRFAVSPTYEIDTRAGRRVADEALRQSSDQLVDAAAPAREERHLGPDVPARLGPAQMAHKVDDAVQLVSLEAQHPLVIAEG